MKKKTKLINIFNKFKIDGISLTSKFANVNITYTNWDEEAAWLMYVELLTRVTTQPIYDDGDEKKALHSIFSIFDISRDILKKYGRKAENFTKVAVIILNQKIRPFTTKWHKVLVDSDFKDKEVWKNFRKELESLRFIIIAYAKLLADMANVEDLTSLNYK